VADRADSLSDDMTEAPSTAEAPPAPAARPLQMNPPTVRFIRQYELVDRVRQYLPDVDEDLLNRAYVFAMKAHGAQRRATGDPYFVHPLEVAAILTGLRLDSASIAAALLHDTIEDTDATYEDIQRLFGDDVARLVDGVTKLTRLSSTSAQVKQAENFRKLVMAMADDLRVLLIKLADRVHNMRTLGFVRAPEKRHRIALETLDIFAPLADRIGISEMKEELELLSFAELQPDAYEAIRTRLATMRSSGDSIVERILESIRGILKDHDIHGEVTGREKSPYSIWRKMTANNVSFEQLSDIMAFRVVLDDDDPDHVKGEIYRTLGVLHSAFRVMPGRFKDYISTPKGNGYQSLHTTLLWPEGHRIEVQIRSRQMHEIAQYGVAAHWHYKQTRDNKFDTEPEEFKWLRNVVDIMETAHHPEEFLEHTKLELFQDQVFCFTPNGDLISLPKTATPVDFAYAVHSELGDRCVGARVNGRMVPLHTGLKNGDQVEIQTSRAQTPSPDWLRFVKTGKARARIRRAQRERMRDEHINLGRTLLSRVFKQAGYDYGDSRLNTALETLRLDSVDDVLANIGGGMLGAKEVFNAVYPGDRSFEKPDLVPQPQKLLNKERSKPRKDGQTLPVRGVLSGMAMAFGRCCHPLPGDRIIGIVTTGKGVTIHRSDCETLHAFDNTPERWIDVAWDDTAGERRHVGRLSVVMVNEAGSLGGLSTTIAKNGGNIANLRVDNRSSDFWTMSLDVEVEDTRHLTNIMAALRALRSVTSVDRDYGA